MRDLSRQYDLANWSGKTLSDEDAALIEGAVLVTLECCGNGLFHFDLLESCNSIGWGIEHPMALWTLALYANVFPTFLPEISDQDHLGKIHFSGPDVVLAQSRLNLFWDDRDLVCLAMNRQKAPGKDCPAWQRPGARPYQRW